MQLWQWKSLAPYEFAYIQLLLSLTLEREMLKVFVVQSAWTYIFSDTGRCCSFMKSTSKLRVPKNPFLSFPHNRLVRRPSLQGHFLMVPLRYHGSWNELQYGQQLTKVGPWRTGYAKIHSCDVEKLADYFGLDWILFRTEWVYMERLLAALKPTLLLNPKVIHNQNWRLILADEGAPWNRANTVSGRGGLFVICWLLRKPPTRQFCVPQCS